MNSLKAEIEKSLESFIFDNMPDGRAKTNNTLALKKFFDNDSIEIDHFLSYLNSIDHQPENKFSIESENNKSDESNASAMLKSTHANEHTYFNRIFESPTHCEKFISMAAEKSFTDYSNAWQEKKVREMFGGLEVKAGQKIMNAFEQGEFSEKILTIPQKAFILMGMDTGVIEKSLKTIYDENPQDNNKKSWNLDFLSSCRQIWKKSLSDDAALVSYAVDKEHKKISKTICAIAKIKSFSSMTNKEKSMVVQSLGDDIDNVKNKSELSHFMSDKNDSGKTSDLSLYFDSWAANAAGALDSESKLDLLNYLDQKSYFKSNKNKNLVIDFISMYPVIDSTSYFRTIGSMLSGKTCVTLVLNTVFDSLPAVLEQDRDDKIKRELSYFSTLPTVREFPEIYVLMNYDEKNNSIGLLKDSSQEGKDVSPDNSSVLMTKQMPESIGFFCQLNAAHNHTAYRDRYDGGMSADSLVIARYEKGVLQNLLPARDLDPQSRRWDINDKSNALALRLNSIMKLTEHVEAKQSKTFASSLLQSIEKNRAQNNGMDELTPKKTLTSLP